MTTSIAAAPASDAPDPILAAITAVIGPGVTERGFVDTLSMIRMREIARLLHYRIATMYPPDDVARCVAILDGLSEGAARRLLRSPALCQIVRLGVGGGRLRDLLECEASIDEDGHRNAWCSTGAVWLGREPPPGDLPVQVEDGRFRAPHLACGISLDLSLAPALEYPSAGLVSPRIPDRGSMREGARIIDEAVRTLDDVYPIGYAAFVGLTSNLILRDDPSRAEECWGSTSGIAIGRVVVANPLAAARPPILADVLLHEATHNVLACAELEAPLLTVEAEADAAYVVSPWTGVPLSPRVLIHACAVWAILLGYWDRYLDRHRGDDAVRARYRYIRCGFERLDQESLLAPIARCLAPPAYRIVAAACETFAASRPRT